MKNVVRMLATLTATSLLLVPAAAGTAAPPSSTGKPLTVMTRNVYLGGDINRPIVAVGGLTGAAALVALANSNHVLRQIVDATDFPVRARLLAREIATRQPDLVGLQEVALWRSEPFDPAHIGVADAEHVDLDFLEILTSEIAAAGAAYRVVVVQEESDVEAPAFTGSPYNGTIADASDQRLTMRDVILMRADKGLQVTDSGSDQYAARLPISLAGVPLAFVRGYTWVDVRNGSTRLRFINTHLESASSDLALLQARELLAGPANHAGNTVLVCDCNSDPLDHSVKQTDPGGTPHSGPYDYIRNQGFTDEWLTQAPAEQGWTSGLSETVDDPSAAGFDHRIDMVFARGAVTADKGWVTGNVVGDRDPTTGLWPSDHAGVVLRLRGFA